MFRKAEVSNYVTRLAAFGHGSLSEFTLPSAVSLKDSGRPSAHELQWRKVLVRERGFGEWTLRPKWKKWNKKDEMKIAAKQKMSARQRTPGYVEKHRTFRLRKVPVPTKLDSNLTGARKVSVRERDLSS